ncbi:Fels-1 Prophage Protein-like [Raoultella planticola]|uniref:Fels-1 Prophage Protein-like n=1 Tax=Raoultella planticola TaxID=575 RepID=A0A485CXN1_RAOPL|nr:Fels-1 Prophage Protein-like [Raoultella planticola]
MHINIKPCLLTLLLATAAIPVCAKQPVSLYSPEAQVLCDKYICATATDGVSHAMTEKYLGKEAVKRLSSQGKFDPSSFTFADGTFCDIKESCAVKTDITAQRVNTAGQFRQNIPGCCSGNKSFPLTRGEGQGSHLRLCDPCPEPVLLSAGRVPAPVLSTFARRPRSSIRSGVRANEAPFALRAVVPSRSPDVAVFLNIPASFHKDSQPIRVPLAIFLIQNNRFSLSGMQLILWVSYE